MSGGGSIDKLLIVAVSSLLRAANQETYQLIGNQLSRGYDTVARYQRRFTKTQTCQGCKR